MCAQISHFWIIMLGLIIYNVSTFIPEWGRNNENNLFLVYHCKSCMHYFLRNWLIKLLQTHTKREFWSMLNDFETFYVVMRFNNFSYLIDFNFGWICEIWNSNIISRKLFYEQFQDKKAKSDMKIVSKKRYIWYWRYLASFFQLDDYADNLFEK